MMAGSKAKGIPSWQKDSQSTSINDHTSGSLQNDDPVYSQASAALASQSEDKSSRPSSEAANLPHNDDPVYAQQDAATSTKSDSNSTSESSSLSTTTDSDPQLPSRSSLVASASKFLQHEDLRGASLERKTAFLEEKGLTKTEIQDLLDTQSSTMPTTTSSTSTPPPPIITYPEFLLHAHRPKPLVTRTRIINAVYATGLISGTLYLASRYLFEPMAEQMAVARHELFETAQKGVETLNTRLEQNVSVIPLTKNGVDDTAEAESVASDPEELFHRDIGVQTSPKIESEADEGEINSADYNATERHASKVKELREHINSLTETGKDALEEEEATRSVVGDLQAYLEELAYGGRKPTFTWENGYGSDALRNKNDSKLDEVAKFKAEIRSVKGALLSARNFPSGSVRVK